MKKGIWKGEDGWWRIQKEDWKLPVVVSTFEEATRKYFGYKWKIHFENLYKQGTFEILPALTVRKQDEYLGIYLSFMFWEISFER